MPPFAAGPIGTGGTTTATPLAASAAGAGPCVWSKAGHMWRPLERQGVGPDCADSPKVLTARPLWRLLLSTATVVLHNMVTSLELARAIV